MHKFPLLTTNAINTLLKKTQGYVKKFEYTLGGMIYGFFDMVYQKKERDIDFSGIDDLHYLEQVKACLVTYRSDTLHKYKKLHYTYLISKIEDRIFTLQNTSGSISALDRINHIIKSGDIILISYQSHGFSWNAFLNNIVSDALRLASRSLFAHVGLVGTLVADDKGHRWIHSTLHNDDKRTGVKKLLLNDYLRNNMPEDILVVRYTGTDTQHINDMIAYGDKLAQEKVGYDQWDALEDVTGTSYFRKDDAFNCAEFVYSCLKSISPGFTVDKKGLPASYVDHVFLEQVYLTKFQ